MPGLAAKFRLPFQNIAPVGDSIYWIINCAQIRNGVIIRPIQKGRKGENRLLCETLNSTQIQRSRSSA